MTARLKTHEQDLASANNTAKIKARARQQRARIGLIFSVVAIWLFQTAYVTVKAVNDPLILDDVEKFISLIAITGGLVALLVVKLWPESEGECPPP